MFDRYGGDNKTKLRDLDKFYVSGDGTCSIPVLNIYSLLSAENTTSVPKRFYGKQGRDVAWGVKSHCEIVGSCGADPTLSTIYDEAGKPYKPGDIRIKVMNHVARLPKGIPNPKSRPMIPTGWNVSFEFVLQKNELLNAATLKMMVEQGGILGLGTFRPIFGRYMVEWQ